MRIVRCDESNREAWNAFVDRSPDASFYHRFEWSRINQECFGHQTCYLAAVEEDQIRGVFPLVQVRSRLFGNIACSMPFVNYGGPCADAPEIEMQLLDEAARVAAEWNVDYVEIRSRRDLGPQFPSSDHKVSMTVDLAPDADKLWTAYKHGHRQEIRRGYKNGFIARFGGGELLDDFYRVLAESWRDLGTPVYAKDYLRNIVRTFPDRVRLCVVSVGDQPAAAAFCGGHGTVVEGMWLGTRNQFRKQHVGYVMYWELIKDACERGFSRFHLGRSTVNSGGEAFKKRWNAVAMPLYWQYILRTRGDIPQLNVMNPRYRLAINTWRKLPVSVTQMVGPMLAGSIP